MPPYSDPAPLIPPDKWMLIYKENSVTKVETVIAFNISYKLNEIAESKTKTLLKVLDGDSIDDLIKYCK